MARTTFPVGDEVDAAVEDRLSYGDSESEWVANAVRLRLAIESILDDLDESCGSGERVEFVEQELERKTGDME